MVADWAVEPTANSSKPNGWIGRREWQLVSRALSRLPRGASVLDIPCGEVRWLEPLLARGYCVTCADPSEWALSCASNRWREVATAYSRSPQPSFVLGQPLETSFPSRHFDAVICTGFFDRLRSSDLRIEALGELRRISRGPIIVSFCNAFALGALRLQATRNRSPIGRRRIPIPVWAFLNDLRRAGLKPIERRSVLWGISPLWHIVSVPAASRAGGLFAVPSSAVAKAA
jgi:hypothetical protein